MAQLFLCTTMSAGKKSLILRNEDLYRKPYSIQNAYFSLNTSFMIYFLPPRSSLYILGNILALHSQVALQRQSNKV